MWRLGETGLTGVRSDIMRLIFISTITDTLMDTHALLDNLSNIISSFSLSFILVHLKGSNQQHMPRMSHVTRHQ